MTKEPGMREPTAEPRKPMDLSLNSRANIREGVSEDMVLEESRQQVMFKNEPQYDLMIAAYNQLDGIKADAKGDVSKSFEAIQTIFKENNGGVRIGKETKIIAEAQYIEELIPLIQPINAYAARVGYSTGIVETSMSEMISEEVKKEMRLMMGGDADVAIENIQNREEQNSTMESEDVKKKLDKLNEAQESMFQENDRLRKKAENQFKANQENNYMTKMNRANRRSKQSTPQPRNKTTAVANKPSKEERLAEKRNLFQNAVSEISNDFFKLSGDIESIKDKAIEIVKMSFDDDSAEAAAQLVVMASKAEEMMVGIIGDNDESDDTGGNLADDGYFEEDEE